VATKTKTTVPNYFDRLARQHAAADRMEARREARKVRKG
jgi:hypothetical protein